MVPYEPVYSKCIPVTRNLILLIDHQQIDPTEQSWRYKTMACVYLNPNGAVGNSSD